MPSLARKQKRIVDYMKCETMQKHPLWQYDEMKPVGVDYTSTQKVQDYDDKINKVRNIEKESSDILKELCISKEQRIIELGTGTGNFAIAAAKDCQKVFAVDVSPIMLEYAKKKTESKNIRNVEFFNGGFLTYQHNDDPVDAIVTQFALHHLPDFWKLIALKRLRCMLKENGRLYIKDTVYSFNVDDHKNFFNELINKSTASGGEQFAKDIEKSVSSEYVTLDWIMENLLIKAGFTIEKADYQKSFLARYICKKS